MRLLLYVAQLHFISQFCRLQVCFAFACWSVCLCLCACFAIAYAFAFVYCNVAFHIRRVCRLHVCVALVFLVGLFVLVWLFCE